MRRSARAFTLIELMVSCAILSLLLTMAFQVISPALHLVQEGSVKVDMEEQGMVAIQQIFSELQKTTPNGTTLDTPLTSTDPMILATNPIVSLDASGFPIFENKIRVFYWLPDKRRLYRKEYGPGPPTIVLPYSATTGIQVPFAALSQIIAQSNGTERSVCLNVDLFKVEREQTTGGEVYRVRLQMSQVLPNKVIKTDLYRKLFLRNH